MSEMRAENKRKYIQIIYKSWYWQKLPVCAYMCVCARHFSNTFAGLNSHSIAKVVQQFSVIERVYRKNRRQRQRRQRRRAASCVRCPSGHWTFGKSLQLMPQFTLRLKGFTANSTSNTTGDGGEGEAVESFLQFAFHWPLSPLHLCNNPTGAHTDIFALLYVLCATSIYVHVFMCV